MVPGLAEILAAAGDKHVMRALDQIVPMWTL